MIDLSVNGGYYLYGNQIYERKLDLYNKIWSENNFIHSPILFWFHDELFSKQDWLTEPAISITELYKQRALQIREKYDYLILMFSGGSDSANVLDTFIDNGIFIDEVRTYYPIKRISPVVATLDPKHPLGLAFEYIWAALPRLKKLEQQSPKTKITVVDISDTLQTSIVNEKEMERSLEANLTVPNYHSIKMIFQTDDTERYVDEIKKQNVAVIYGADRPSLDMIDGSLYFFFTDAGCSCSCTDYRTQSNLSRVNFYWSKDAPLIPIKQSHMIKNLLASNKKLFDISNGHNRFGYHLHQSNLIRCLMYPTWDPHTYQKEGKLFDDGLFDFSDREKQASARYNQIVIDKLKSVSNNRFSPLVIEQNRHMVTSRRYKVADISCATSR
jgi:hypothetical protein